MTTWACVSVSTTFLTQAPIFLLPLVSFYFIRREITIDTPIDKRQEVIYKKLESSDNDHENGSTILGESSSESNLSENCRHENHKDNHGIANSTDNLNESLTCEENSNENHNINAIDDIPRQTERLKKFDSDDKLSVKRKLVVFKQVLCLVGLPSFWTFFSEYVLLQSLITTLAYQNLPFPPRDHYVYYSLLFMTGEVMGRSICGIIGLIKPTWYLKPTRSLLMLLALMEMLHMFFFLLESWYRFLPGIGITLLLCFTGGFIVGLLFFLTFEITRINFEGLEREFALPLSLVPFVVSVFLAALIGLYVEPIIKEHCMSEAINSEFCFTRSSSIAEIIETCKATMHM